MFQNTTLCLKADIESGKHRELEHVEVKESISFNIKYNIMDLPEFFAIIFRNEDPTLNILYQFGFNNFFPSSILAINV